MIRSELAAPSPRIAHYQS